jgi:predicted RND superfamily exporter protein
MNNKQSKLKIKAGLIVLVVFLISVFFVYETKEYARMETDLDEYMPKEHPAFVYSDQAEEWFNIKDGILIAVENKNGIYNSKSLQKIKDITIVLQEMDEFEEIDVMSVYSADNITGSEEGMEVEAFYLEVPETKEELAFLRESVKSNDMVFGRFVSEDETVALIAAGMNDTTFTASFYNQILDIAKSYEGNGDEIYVAGRPIVEGTMALLGPADMKRMVPIVLIVIALVLFFLLRSIRATTATLITVFISSIWTFGLMAALRIPIFSVSTMIPVMLIAIGVAYGIYFYNHLKQFFTENPSSTRKDAVFHTLEVLWKPLLMAAFTTMIGFISLLSSQVYPIKYFGIFTAFGIFTSFIMTLVFLPAFVILLGYKNKTQKKKLSKKEKLNNKFIKLTDVLFKRKKAIFLISLLIVIASIIGIQRVWINSSFLDKFEKDSEIVLTDAFVNSKFGGTSTLNVILESKDVGVFKQPENLRLIDDMQQETESLSKVGNSFSLTDYLKRMNKVMNADKESFYTIPDNSELIAQYLLLYEMSGDPENITKLVNYDYNKTNITFQLKGDDSKTINAALNIINKYDEKFAANGIQLNFAGSGYKGLVFTELILEGQVMSILISLGLVLLLLSIMFKSFKAGLIGSLPIVITALISFGVMGIFNIPLSTTTALLSSIAIGIGIDYAIHFIQHYRRNLTITTVPLQAIYLTMKQTGKAIIYNAIVVIAGFLVLLFSVFPPNRTLGALVSMNMFTSLLGTLSIMMILLFSFKVFIKKDKNN